MGPAIPSPWFVKTFQINILSPSAGKLIWLYPPTMNLLAILFAKLPLGTSFWAWRAFSGAVAGLLLRYAGLPWVVIVAGVLSPAGLHDTLGGQNGTFIGALVVSALLIMDRNPRIGGAVAGMLCIKPQAALIFPLILLQKRQKAFWSCAIIVAGMIGVSLLVEGMKPWIWFFTVAQQVSRRILQTPFTEYFPAGGCTVFMMARSLHASLRCAWVVQACCAGGASVLVWNLWRKQNENPVAAMAATVSLAALITPYGFLYDLTGFAIGMAAMIFSAPMCLKPVFALLWLASGYILTVANLTGLLLFPMVALAGAILSWILIEPFG